MSSSNNGHLDWKACKIRVFQSFYILRDVNMMLKIRARTFLTRSFAEVEIFVKLW